MVKQLFLFYRRILFPLLVGFSGGGSQYGCLHEPSCSQICEKEILQKGWKRGLSTGFKQLLRCHSWR